MSASANKSKVQEGKGRRSPTRPLRREAPPRATLVRAVVAFLPTVAVVVAALLTAGGCGGNSGSQSAGPIGGPPQAELDNLDVAMQFFDQLEVPPNIEEAPDIDPARIRAQVMYHLDRWVDQQPPDDGWIVDPLVRRLPRALRASAGVDELTTMRFGLQDVHSLQEASWHRALSEWVTQRHRDEDFGYLIAQAGPVSATDRDKLASALRALDPSLDKSSAPALASALRLFDWTVRSIQLEPLLPYPKDVVGPQPDANPSALEAITPPPARAIPGPGYQRFPWQVLLYGRGDAWERARAFVLLCRQQGIDAVVLGFDTADPPQPWVAAVMIAGKLYLFDTALGLPLPGPGGVGILTLDQAIADPGVLRQLDIPAEGDGEPLVYPVQADDLSHVVALVEATPQSLSQRMRVLERSLAGDRRVVLTTSPSKLARTLADAEGVQSVRLWNVPFETIMYRSALAERVKTDREAALAFYATEGPLSRFNSLVIGRQRQLRGAMEVEEADRGAIGYFMDARISDAQINQIATSPELQNFLGITESLPSDEASRQQALAMITADYFRIKRTAGFWLGQVHFEQRHYHDAKYWFEKTREAEPHGWWEPGARYNLARAHELLGDVSRATELYRGDDSPQRHGNLLRARLLQSESQPPAASDDAVSDDAASDDAASDDAASDDAASDDAPPDDAASDDAASAD